MLKMKELKLAIFLCITLMVAAVSPVHGQTGGTFVVNVMCSDTMGMPVMNDTVIFTNVQTNTSQAITSPTGDFPVSLPAGPYTVRIISSAGFFRHLTSHHNDIDASDSNPGKRHGFRVCV